MCKDNYEKTEFFEDGNSKKMKLWNLKTQNEQFLCRKKKLAGKKC